MQFHGLKRTGRLLVVLVPATIIPGLMWLAGSEFGENLLVQVLGTWLTVFAIDVVIRASDEEAKRPVREAMISEACMIHANLGFFLRMMIEVSLEPGDKELDDAISTGDLAVFEPLMKRLNSKTPAVVHDDGRTNFTIGDIVERFLMPLLPDVNRFIQRYVSVADPELIAELQRFERNVFFAIARSLNARAASDGMLVFGWPEWIGVWKDLRPKIAAEIAKSTKPDRVLTTIDFEKVKTDLEARAAKRPPG